MEFCLTGKKEYTTEKLERDDIIRRYKEKMKGGWYNRREEKWEILKYSIKICAKEGYGRKRVGGLGKMGCEWWNEDI